MSLSNGRRGHEQTTKQGGTAPREEQPCCGTRNSAVPLTRRRPQVALVTEKANRNPPREYKGNKEDEGSWAPPPTREKHRREHQILVAMASRTAMGPPHSSHEAWVRVTRSQRGCVGQIGEPAHRYGSHQHTAASFGVAPLAAMGVLIRVAGLIRCPSWVLGRVSHLSSATPAPHLRG
jgi:hypothetical protein